MIIGAIQFESVRLSCHTRCDSGETNLEKEHNFDSLRKQFSQKAVGLIPAFLIIKKKFRGINLIFWMSKPDTYG